MEPRAHRALAHCEVYLDAVRTLQRAAGPLDQFSGRLRQDPELQRLRMAGRAELQAIFDQISAHFDLGPVPVYFPVRKKISIWGRAYVCAEVPQEIRIYPIHGPAGKPYANWRPSDLLINSREEVFEILLHESAHALEARRFATLGHEQRFVAAYEEIERFLLAAGYGTLMAPGLRLFGAPPNSCAARVARSGQNRRPSLPAVPTGPAASTTVVEHRPEEQVVARFMRAIARWWTGSA
jgi:hypothetical protein